MSDQPELTDLLTEGNKSFRFQNQRAMLTYKSHLDKTAFVDFLSKKWEYKSCYVAHEKGDSSHGYDHTHVVVDFGKSKQTKNCRFFDFENIHPNISIIKSKLAFKISCKYICKEDKTVIINKDDEMAEADKIWSFKSLAEALRHYSLDSAMKVIAVWQHKPFELPEPDLHEEDFYPWQVEMKKRLEEPATGRITIWAYEVKGNVGKTVFAKHMCLTYPDKCIMFNSIGKLSDFANNMQTFYKLGWRGDTVFLNLSRAYSDRDNLYEACEQITDGFITCTKYTGGCLWLTKMHIVVFANFAPKTNSTKTLSADRWEIYEIEGTQSPLRGIAL